MSMRHIEIDGPYRSRMHQRRVRQQLAALTAAMVLLASPYIALAIHRFAGA